jgi:Protein of unknown function (DUF1800)
MRGCCMSTAIDPKWAWEPYRPTDQNPWDLRKAGHLYRRAAFGATWAELQAAVAAGPEKAVADLLAGGPDGPPFPNSIRKGNVGPQLPAWWLVRLHETRHPLREKLTIFWHNHFATSNAKVNNAGFMIGMYDLLYRHALGNFRDLLQEVSKDPAMLVWLDTAQSRKGMPNENYARELMELFSLGIGNYTEQDIREAARAFTGWEIKGGRAAFNRAQFDTGEKTVLGQSGPWTGEDVVRICLEQKCCPYFIAGKLVRYLVSETLPTPPELLAPLADPFRTSGYDFGAMVATVLRSNLFFSPHAYRARVKAPVEFALGIVRAMEGNVPMGALAPALEALGQRLFYPPSVKGWDGGPAWLNGQTLLFRQNLAFELTSTRGRFNSRTDPAALARRHGKQSDAEVVDFFLDLFLQGDVPAASREQLLNYMRQAPRQGALPYEPDDVTRDHPVRALCHLVLTLPEFQLD